MIVNRDTYKKVILFKEFVTEEKVLDLINEYIDNKIADKRVYENTDTIIKFSVNKYDYRNTGLQGNYDDFYEYSDETNKTYIISRNGEKLSAFCGYINRLTNW